MQGWRLARRARLGLRISGSLANAGALTIGIGFRGPFYYNYNKGTSEYFSVPIK